MAYSAGVLPEAFSLVVATHVSMCDECRCRLNAYEALGGAVLDECGVAELDESSLTSTLALIAGMPEDETPDTDLPVETRPAQPVLPGPLRDYVGGDLDAVKWRPVGGGVKQAVLRTADAEGPTVRLIRIPAGASVPGHGHKGTEVTMVLKGAFCDETSYFGPGDVELADEDLEHMPVAMDGEDCICLSVTDAPLRFNSLLPRLAQPFIGI